VVTFLFTDVEGSTRRWEADADAMRTALAAHDAVLRTAIEAHSGFLFKHTGDGVCAAFASAPSAVEAAVVWHEAGGHIKAVPICSGTLRSRSLATSTGTRPMTQPGPRWMGWPVGSGCDLAGLRSRRR
jgi:hypothetical protein